ncbi:MAG TPA: alkyl sulfatase dimerization domain-containing protein [Rhizomicrobium sp.]|jgi:alkyl sulfatase BDS1-like metallo-beta-lactamase superfamily hydrolase|nr:alkyl sulfatase dimerization domain-containing protein [Rhizomicrobium sp.]
MTAIDHIRGTIADTLHQWGVAPDALAGKHLDTATHGGKASLGSESHGRVPGRGRGRFALDTVHVRKGHRIELDVVADLVANTLEIEPGGEIVIAEGSRFIVGKLISGGASQVTIKLKNGKNGLDGMAPGQKGFDGGDAPAIANLPFLAAAIVGTFTLKIIGGNGGSGGAGGKGADGGKGGNGTQVGAITILYGTKKMVGKVKLVVDGLKPGKGGAAGAAGGKRGKSGTAGSAAEPVLRQLTPPKPATAHTAKFNRDVAKRPIFTKPSNDFTTAKQGQVAPAPRIVKDAQGNIVWDLNSYRFLDEKNKAPDTVNPSLWRNAQLNYFNGLYLITTNDAGWGIYQARGMDLAVVTFIEAANSVIVVDPLTTAQAAQAAWELMKAELARQGKAKEIRCIIYSHTHVDHDGGVGGLVEVGQTQAPPGEQPEVKVIAPIGFMEEATSENVYAGTAMGRRATYMYGNILPRGPRAQVGAGLGLGLSTGTITLIGPNISIEENNIDDPMDVDGVDVVFQLTPGTEAPAEMNIFFPGYKTLHIAENCTHTLHNILTLRGAKVRDALAWADYLTESLELFGDKTDIMIAAHHWPTWGKAQVAEMIESQRDMYKFLNDQVLQLLNQGYTLTEIGNKMELPPTLADKWYNQGYYGTINHNSKAVYQRYIGWFDGVPAHLHPLDPVEEGAKYVEYMGGAKALLKRARKDFKAGNYRWVASVVNQLVFADPTDEDAKHLLADAYEQMGYQATSAPWRNFYLGGAQELRNGVAILSNPNSGSADTLAAMSMDEFLAFVCVLIDAKKADGVFVEFVLNLEADERYEAHMYSLRLKNSVLVFAEIEDRTAIPDVQAVVTTTRLVLNRIIGGEIDFADGLNDGTVTIGGPRPQAVLVFAATLVAPFNPWFNIVTP